MVGLGQVNTEYPPRGSLVSHDRPDDRQPNHSIVSQRSSLELYGWVYRDV